MNIQTESMLGFDMKVKVSDEPGVAFLLLHGYGADAADLYPIADYMKTQTKVHWYVPDAPSMIPGFFGGRQWFPIDMEKLQRAQLTGNFRERFRDAVPDGLDEMAAKVILLARQLKERHGKLIVGGFSQGSMVSLYACLKEKELADALILLSSTFIAEQTLGKEILEGMPFPIYQSHGVSDPVLPVSEARDLADYLKRGCEQYQSKQVYTEFPGGHEIPIDVFQGMSSFIDEVFHAS